MPHQGEKAGEVKNYSSDLDSEQRSGINAALLSARGSEAPGDRGVNAEGRHDLFAGAFDAHRQIGAELRAEPAAPGEIDLRAEINTGLGSVMRGHAIARVFWLVFTRDDGLEGKGVIIFHRHVNPRAAGPTQVVGVLIAKIAFAANGVLRSGGEK